MKLTTRLTLAVCILSLTRFASGQALAPGPGAASPSQQPAYFASPPGVVNGLYKPPASSFPNAYAAFQLAVQGLSPAQFNATAQQNYINNLATYFANASFSSIAILRLDSSSQVAPAPNSGGQGIITQPPPGFGMPPNGPVGPGGQGGNPMMTSPSNQGGNSMMTSPGGQGSSPMMNIPATGRSGGQNGQQTSAGVPSGAVAPPMTAPAPGPGHSRKLMAASSTNPGSSTSPGFSTSPASPASPALGSSTLYIYTAITLTASVNNLFSLHSALKNPITAASFVGLNLQAGSAYLNNDIVYGIANPGYSPRVGAGSPIVTFVATLPGVNFTKNSPTSNLEPFLISFPVAVLNATNAPDTTVVLLEINNDYKNNVVLSMAAIFNRAPITNAYQSSNLFYNKLNASMYNSSLVTFPNYTQATSNIFVYDITQQNATTDGGFYSDQAEAIIYNPVNGTGPGTGSTGPPADTNKVVAFTVKLTAFDHAAFYQKNPNTGLTAAQLYTFNLDSYLQANLNPLAYSLITGDSPGSLNVQTAAYIPFAASNPASSASAASAVTNLQATLTSSSALGSIFDPSTFGTASVDPSSVTVSNVAVAPPPPPPAATGGSKTNKGAIAGGVIGGVVGLGLLCTAGYFIYTKLIVHKGYGQA